MVDPDTLRSFRFGCPAIKRAGYKRPDRACAAVSESAAASVQHNASDSQSPVEYIFTWSAYAPPSSRLSRPTVMMF